MEPTSQPTSPAIPIAIISGFAMIAIAIFFTNSGGTSETTELTDNSPESQQLTSEPSPIGDNDYIRGNPNAPILIVEYSDYDCPFCKQYHETMSKIMNEFGVTGRVAWVYRQFPLAQLHPNSPKISEAALCVGKLGGSKSFWSFTDAIFDGRDLESPTNVTKLLSYAETAGVDPNSYKDCLNNHETEQAVLDSIDDATKAGAQGTPYTVLMVGDQQAVISGAQEYQTVRGIVQNLIDQLDGTFEEEVLLSTPVQEGA